ncbi:UDP-N-acetylmuramoyl-tripeptide--D-alanyl-D-alanine ligase [bacterium]|nr:UDP-N-acetylmuramoyl-tripeptide--D-alanyl-D-alanine ligase [bacterium]
MKRIIERILKFLTVSYIKKNNPEIIAITGSVGKTTTRKAITYVLGKRYSVRSFEEHSYNTEIGVPLSVFGKKIPNYRMLWILVIFGCVWELFFGKKYDILILEMGADKPGDISYFLNFIRPKVSVVTRVTAAHMDGFKSIDNILAEKSKIVKILKKEDMAILNGDDSLILPLAKEIQSNVITYGLSQDNDIYAKNIKYSDKGLNCIISIMGREYNFSPKILGEHSLYSLLAAVCVGVKFKIEDKEIISYLLDFRPVKGRMNLISGVRDTLIIDDSYNANPVSMIKALETLSNVAKKRRVAVLGTMNELGSYSESGHKEVGQKIKEFVDILVTVGDGGKIIAEEAIKSGFPEENVYIRGVSDDAGNVLKGIIDKSDTVLFKGSQNKVMLERAIFKIMKYPKTANSVLVRQTRRWIEK